MENFDDLFDTQNNKGQTFDADGWKERKLQQREYVYALLDEGTQNVATNYEHFRNYLDIQTRFNQYSVSNAILISHQMPDASAIAPFKTWKEGGVYIKKSEEAILILEPGNEYTREDGSKGIGMNVKRVFDISQTELYRKTYPEEKPEQRSTLKFLIASSPCKILSSETLPENVCARYSPEDNKIYIRPGMSGDDIFRSLSQEIAVANSARRKISRDDCIFTAYCVSYMLCNKYGFSIEDFSFERAPEQFEGMESKDIREKLGDIRNMANTILHEMRRQLGKNFYTKENDTR